MAAVNVPSQTARDSTVRIRELGLKKPRDDQSKLPGLPPCKQANSKPSCRQSPPRCRAEKTPFIRDVSPLAMTSNKKQEESVVRTRPVVTRYPSRSATVPMRKKDLDTIKSRSPRAVRKLEPLNHKPSPKSFEDSDATKSGIEQVGYPLKKARGSLPAIRLSCPAIIVTDTDDMAGTLRIEKSASETGFASS